MDDNDPTLDDMPRWKSDHDLSMNDPLRDPRLGNGERRSTAASGHRETEAGDDRQSKGIGSDRSSHETMIPRR
jgi:hypothetical protein